MGMWPPSGSYSLDSFMEYWQHYDEYWIRKKFQDSPYRVHMALEARPEWEEAFRSEWMTAAENFDISALSDMAEEWLDRAVELVLSYGKGEK